MIRTALQSLLMATALVCHDATASAEYADIILADKPVAYWPLNDHANNANHDQSGSTIQAHASVANASALTGALHHIQLGVAGPRPGMFPGFNKSNSAAGFEGSGMWVQVKDSGTKSALDFDNGDTITLEAWVNPFSTTNGQQVYVIGKGRTKSGKDNQNWALRLRGEGGSCRVSFLFRSREQPNWHRWISHEGFMPRTGWHHIAVTYTFGKHDSLRGYVDGQPTKGWWDMGGATNRPPVVDDDVVWIGSSMAGGSSSTFNGRIDEVAIYRHALSPARIAKRFRIDEKARPKPAIDFAKLPTDKVRVEIIEGIPSGSSWKYDPPPGASLIYDEPVFGFTRFPQKYDKKGIRVDWSNPFLLRAGAKVKLPAGNHKILLRARNGARLSIDGKLIASTPFTSRNGGGHEKVPDMPKSVAEGMRYTPVGHVDRVVEFKSDGREHAVVLESFVGGKSIRQEIGELNAAILVEGEKMFRFIGPTSTSVTLTDRDWTAYAADRIAHHVALDQQRRFRLSQDEKSYWTTRHLLAGQFVSKLKPIEVPVVSKEMPVNNEIDRFIGKQLEAKGITPAPLTISYSFLRRVSLDTIGVVPPLKLMDRFMTSRDPRKREKIIDELLASPRWADNWTGYWQDVLAENPGILKPMLNNTGPFRWWIHESLMDNKPFDRFATELIMMSGSKYGGGPAGFAMSTQNDVPMAAKAHTIGQAFLASNMKCARCHDAPFHDFKQKDLFSMAAMLQRGDLKVPGTSSVPLTEKELKRMIIEVSLKPGANVKPDWTFDHLVDDKQELPTGVIRNPSDAREHLAAMITTPANDRFAKVIVNRIWKRYLGYGLVEPVDDWDGESDTKPSHPQLLEWLARELIANGYDLKHIARLILNSHTYQRAIVGDFEAPSKLKPYHFATPVRRRMTAEQVVDSLFAASGKSFDSEELNLDVDGRRPITTFLNLGVPTRGWEFTSLSNERDRPALSMPKAQSIIDVLSTFGWRQSRQNPVTEREKTPTPLQPAILSNGTVARRIVTLSDNSAFTAIATRKWGIGDVVRNSFLRTLSRTPSQDEWLMFSHMLGPGFRDRLKEVKGQTKQAKKLHAVSWSNHLSPEATKIKLEMERAARAGDPPTQRLDEDWRERMEDMVWALINSPEFVMIP